MTSDTPSEDRLNPWFRLVAAACAAFIVTILLMIAAAFNGRQAGMIRFFNDHGPLLLGVEVAGILGLAAMAMAVDRREALRRRQEHEQAILERVDGEGRSSRER